MKTGKWTDEEKDYLREHWVKDGSVKVGKALDRNHRNVGCAANYLGLRSGWGDKPRFRHYAVNEDIFKTWSRTSAYLVGLILTDGNINKGGRAFNIASKDIELLEKTRKAFSSEHPITKCPDKDLHILSIGSIAIVRDLENIGILQNKSKTLTMPVVPPEYFFDFLRGYIDGDGMIVTRPKRGMHLKLSTGSPYILDDISDIITNMLDIERRNTKTCTGKRRETTSTWYELSYHGAAAVKICEAIYSHCDYLFLSRKYQAFVDYRDRPKNNGLRNNGNATRYK